MKRYFILAGVPQVGRDGRWVDAEDAQIMLKALEEIVRISKDPAVVKLANEAIIAQEHDEED